MTLTKDDLKDIQEAVDTSQIFYDFDYKNKLADKLRNANILKNQEKAEKWDKYLEHCEFKIEDIIKDQKIVERLKKRIEDLQKCKIEADSKRIPDTPIMSISTHLLELQKILKRES